MRTIFGVLVIGLIIWLAWGALHPTTYTGYFYYDVNDLDKYWQQGGLKDIDACRDWVNSQALRDFDGLYDYECGKNCTYRGNYMAVVCETTER